MLPEEVKKRKACNACTKAKAKCSPSEVPAEPCQRCERLKTECVFEDSARRKGLKQRGGRMRQLEARVESLAGLLSTAQGQNPTHEPAKDDSVLATAISIDSIPNAVASLTDSHGFTAPFMALDDSDPDEASVAYDPVDAGLINEAQANLSLDEYRNGFHQQFPFVVIDSSIDANTLRRQQPFLFLSIMAATATRNPTIQRILAEEFRESVATRIVECEHKGLEVLQGLLIHAAYYSYFYSPGKQQLSLMIQLCVATVQDLGIAKSSRANTTGERPIAERRAVLGTYYLAAGFAHAWRTRTSMPYTRSLARLCQTFADQPGHPSDTLIPPLVHLSELMCRINDYFSYDEVGDSEIRGESALNMSTSNFRSELQRMQDYMPESTRQNTTIRLTCSILSVWIHECSLHSALWQDPHAPNNQPITPPRAHMLQRSLTAAQTFVRDFTAAPTPHLYQVPLPIWTGWFYATLVLLKLIFLHDSGGSGALGMKSVVHEMGSLLAEGSKSCGAEGGVYEMTSTLSATSLRDPSIAAREADAVKLFQAFAEKITAAAPEAGGVAGAGAKDKSLFVKVGMLQQGLLAGLKKRIERAHMPAPPYTYHVPAESLAQHPQQQGAPMQQQQQQQYPAGQMQQDPHGQAMPLNYFEHAAVPEYWQDQVLPTDDWVWDLVMDDVNMFNM